MKTIYKYKIETTDSQTISMPKASQVLTVQVQHGKPHIWAYIDNTDNSEEPRTIEVFGTGNPIPEGARRYIGSYQLFGGDLIFHVFEKLE